MLQLALIDKLIKKLSGVILIIVVKAVRRNWKGARLKQKGSKECRDKKEADNKEQVATLKRKEHVLKEQCIDKMRYMS